MFAALALAVPAATLAANGGSAGDQQYTDPFAGTPAPTSTQTSTTPAPAPATATAPVASTPSAGTPAPVTATPAASPAAGSETPAATTTPVPTHPTELPFTGYDSWLAAGLGAAMVAGGLVLRRRARAA